MVTQPNMVAPADSLRKVAVAASDEINEQRACGNKANAGNIEEKIGRVLSSLDRKDGEFVGVNSYDVSTLMAFSPYSDDVKQHKEAIRSFQEQYNHR